MTSELFTCEGLRKYLDDADEHDQFLAAAALERGEVRTIALCTTLAYTGCRISEALELTVDRVDLSKPGRHLSIAQEARHDPLPLGPGSPGPPRHARSRSRAQEGPASQRQGPRYSLVELGPHAGRPPSTCVSRHGRRGDRRPPSLPQGIALRVRRAAGNEDPQPASRAADARSRQSGNNGDLHGRRGPWGGRHATR